MVNKEKYNKIIKELEEKNKKYTVIIDDSDKENKLCGFSIIFHGEECIHSCNLNTYSGLTKETLDLLKEAEIKFTILL